ncbi:rhomboid family intramembrane serine protease [Nocardioides conyzicola]|uniref:Rhomboid family intramembrane serine protease n=1 Tax=Nocardioides conyzicola TaxID=1651781 RepID=A0ABP8XCT7_9ACTN
MTDQPAPAGVPTCYRHPGRESHIRCQRCERPICPDCMRDAAVGFQCPECVAEGKKSTRSGRTAYGGLRPTNASTTTLVLIGLNVAVWIAILATGAASSRLVDLLALRPSGFCDLQNGFVQLHVSQAACNGTWMPGVSDGAYWQLITGAFTHVQLLHIAFNMFALYLFGPQLEIYFGRVRYLALYFISALTGSALVYWAAPEYTPTVGASGAIFGLLGAMLVVSLKIRVNVQGIVVLLAINFLMTATISNISWQGHVGGFVGGVLVAGVLVYAPRRHRTAYQSAGLVALTVVTLLAIVARTAALA